MAKAKKEIKEVFVAKINETYHCETGMIRVVSISQDGILAYYTNNSKGSKTLEFYDHGELEGMVKQ